ncbi:MAG: DciA family protein [Micropepsaceae bacterium]
MSGKGQSDTNGGEMRRSGRRGPRQFAQDAGALLRHHLNARGFAQIELVTRWPEIAGASLAEHCFPYRLSAGGASGSTLTLMADDRAALELQHQTPKLIDKINGYFGKGVVGKIKVVNGDIPRPPAPRARLRALSAGEEAELQRRISSVEDPDLREALLRLGRSALAESGRPPAKR